MKTYHLQMMLPNDRGNYVPVPEMRMTVPKADPHDVRCEIMEFDESGQPVSYLVIARELPEPGHQQSTQLLINFPTGLEPML